MNYTKAQLQDLNKYFKDVPDIYSKIVEKVLNIEKILKNQNAREYLLHGVKRRIDIVNQCIENIFRIFPPDGKELLGMDSVTNIDINLHAFLINIYGIIENLGLFVAYENGLIDLNKPIKKQRYSIGLFNKYFYRKLNKNLINYFSEKNLIKWYEEYAKNYRDALAHRIPPYIPPLELTEKEEKRRKEIEEKIEKFKIDENNYNELHDLLWKTWTLGSPANYFLHSISERSKRVLLHEQIINDFLTIEEIVFTVLDNMYI